jgi:flagellar basal body rod protein FlgG
MLSGLYSAASALDAAATNLDIIAHNLAHVAVPGFRRAVATFSPFEAELQAVSDDPSRTGTLLSAVETDFASGGLETTGRPLDIALDGDGFFVLEGPDGPLYTRNGSFALTADGVLVNTEGRPVQGTGGTIQLPPNTLESQVSVDAEGRLSVQNQLVGQFELVRFADPQQLMRVGTMSFEATPQSRPLPYEGAVVQGARELSNVIAVEELIRMIGNLRYFEASQRALRTIADAVQQTTDPRG